MPLTPFPPIPEPKPKSNKPEVSIFSFGDAHTARLTLLSQLHHQSSPTPKSELEMLLASEQKEPLSFDHHSEEKIFYHLVPVNEAQLHRGVIHRGGFDGAIWLTDGAPPFGHLSILHALHQMDASLLIFLVDESNPRQPPSEEHERRVESLDREESQLREHCSEAGYDGDQIEILRGDPTHERSVHSLLEACDRAFFPRRQTSDAFLMHIEDVFTVRNSRIIVTGRPERGQAKTGEPLEIIGIRPATKLTSITAIESFRRTNNIAVAGINIGIMLGGIERLDVERGQLLVSPGSMQVASRFKAVVYFYSSEQAPSYRALYTPELGQEFQIVLFGHQSRCSLSRGGFIVGDLSLVEIQTQRPLGVEAFASFAIVVQGYSAGVGLVLSFE